MQASCCQRRPQRQPPRSSLSGRSYLLLHFKEGWRLGRFNRLRRKLGDGGAVHRNSRKCAEDRGSPGQTQTGQDPTTLTKFNAHFVYHTETSCMKDSGFQADELRATSDEFIAHDVEQVWQPLSIVLIPACLEARVSRKSTTFRSIWCSNMGSLYLHKRSLVMGYITSVRPPVAKYAVIVIERAALLGSPRKWIVPHQVRRFSGNTISTVRPLPCLEFCALIVPWWYSKACLAMARPRPWPREACCPSSPF